VIRDQQQLATDVQLNRSRASDVMIEDHVLSGADSEEDDQAIVPEL